MTAIRARAVNQPKPGSWEDAVTVATEMVAAADSFDGINFYAMYTDEASGQLVNLAEYRDEAVWRAWIDANRPRGQRLMAAVDVLSMEVYGELTPELHASITSYGSSSVYAELTAWGG